MALTVNHPVLKEQRVHAFSASIGSSPAVAYGVAPFRGIITKVVGITGGAITTADAVVVVKVGTTTVTSGTITVTSGSTAGTAFTNTPSGNNTVNEDDVISFTPAGGTGATVTGSFYAVIQMA